MRGYRAVMDDREKRKVPFFHCEVCNQDLVVQRLPLGEAQAIASDFWWNTGRPAILICSSCFSKEVAK